MAKVTGPLMSLDASGTVAGTVVFSKWHGRNYVRQRVIPQNPRSEDQEFARNDMRVSAAIQRFVNLSEDLRGSETLTDKELLSAGAPTDLAWNSWLVRAIIGTGGANITAAKAAYASLSSAVKVDWEDAAAALSPAITAVGQTAEFGVPGTPVPAGEVFFIYVWALYILGFEAQPSDTPPTYA